MDLLQQPMQIEEEQEEEQQHEAEDRTQTVEEPNAKMQVKRKITKLIIPT